MIEDLEKEFKTKYPWMNKDLIEAYRKAQLNDCLFYSDYLEQTLWGHTMSAIGIIEQNLIVKSKEGVSNKTQQKNWEFMTDVLRMGISLHDIGKIIQNDGHDSIGVFLLSDLSEEYDFSTAQFVMLLKIITYHHILTEPDFYEYFLSEYKLVLSLFIQISEVNFNSHFFNEYSFYNLDDENLDLLVAYYESLIENSLDPDKKDVAEMEDKEYVFEMEVIHDYFFPNNKSVNEIKILVENQVKKGFKKIKVKGHFYGFYDRKVILDLIPEHYTKKCFFVVPPFKKICQAAIENKYAENFDEIIETCSDVVFPFRCEFDSIRIGI